MKKLLALLMSLVMLLSLCACGGGGGGSSDGGSTALDPAASDTNDGQTKDDDPVQTQPIDADATYLSYADLTETENSWLWLDEGDIHLQYDYPSGYRFTGHGNGMGSENDRDFSILIVHSEYPMPDTSLEDAFYTLLNGEDGFRSIERMVVKATYDEVVVDELETVTLESGREAIKFSGTQHMDDYGTIADCPIRGYCTMLGDVPVIVCYVIFDEPGLEADLLDGVEGALSPEEMQHYVDEIINTPRIVEE